MIGMQVLYFGRNENMSTDYSRFYTFEIVGDTPEKCMAEFRMLSQDHDLIKNTKLEIIGISTK